MPTMTKIKLVADIFEESYRLQAEVDDLVSAAEGFDRLIRARRGEPWPEFVRSEDGSTCAREVGNWDWDLNSCARNFLDKNNGTTWFFADRASDNVAATKTGVSSQKSTSCVNKEHRTYGLGNLTACTGNTQWQSGFKPRGSRFVDCLLREACSRVDLLSCRTPLK